MALLHRNYGIELDYTLVYLGCKYHHLQRLLYGDWIYSSHGDLQNDREYYY